MVFARMFLFSLHCQNVKTINNAGYPLLCHTLPTSAQPVSNQGFDLLDPSHESKKLEDLPKVALMEDEDGNIHLRYCHSGGGCNSVTYARYQPYPIQCSWRNYCEHASFHLFATERF